MPLEVLQRDRPFTEPKKQGEVFVLTRARAPPCVSCGVIRSAGSLQLHASGEMLQTQVCRSQDEVFNTFEQWKAAMLEKGWA